MSSPINDLPYSPHGFTNSQISNFLKLYLCIWAMERRTWPIVHCALARAHFTTYTGWKVSLVSAKIEKVESRSIKFVLKNFRLDKIMGNWLIILLIRTIWQILISSCYNRRKRNHWKREFLYLCWNLQKKIVKPHRDNASGSTSIVWLIGCISSQHHGQVWIRAARHQRGQRAQRVEAGPEPDQSGRNHHGQPR